MRHLLVIVFIFLTFSIIVENYFPEPKRAPKIRPKSSPNQGPYFGQPEQVALSHAGKSLQNVLIILSFLRLKAFY